MKKTTLVLFVFCYCNLKFAQAQWDSITNFNQVIFDLKAFDSKLFIGGGFTKLNAQTCYWSAYYDGSGFTRHTDMIGGSGIDKLEVFNGELYAVGGLTFSSTIGVGVWDGSTWQDGGSTNYSHSLICAVGNDLYVQSDNNKLRKKTGSGSFQAFYDFPSGGATALFNYNGDLIVAGTFDSIGGVVAKNIARWNGSVWQPLGTGISGGTKCIAAYNGELYVAGNITLAGGTTVKNIAKWNGSSWSAVGGVLTSNNYNGIRDMVVYSTNLIVVGDIDQMGGVNTGNVAAWNGSQWIGLGLNHDDSFVQCAEVFNGELYVGTFDFDRSHLFKYTGSVGIAENEKNYVVKIYPSPFSNALTVPLPANSQASITLYDFSGRQVLQQSLSNTATVNTEQLSNGFYFYELRNAKEVISTGKIVKQ